MCTFQKVFNNDGRYTNKKPCYIQNHPAQTCLFVSVVKTVSSKCFAHLDTCFTRYFDTEWFKLSTFDHPSKILLCVPSITPPSQPVNEHILPLRDITMTFNLQSDKKPYLIACRLPNGHLRYDRPDVSTDIVPQTLAGLALEYVIRRTWSYKGKPNQTRACAGQQFIS